MQLIQCLPSEVTTRIFQATDCATFLGLGRVCVSLYNSILKPYYTQEEYKAQELVYRSYASQHSVQLGKVITTYNSGTYYSEFHRHNSLKMRLILAFYNQLHHKVTDKNLRFRIEVKRMLLNYIYHKRRKTVWVHVAIANRHQVEYVHQLVDQLGCLVATDMCGDSTCRRQFHVKITPRTQTVYVSLHQEPLLPTYILYPCVMDAIEVDNAEMFISAVEHIPIIVDTHSSELHYSVTYKFIYQAILENGAGACFAAMRSKYKDKGDDRLYWCVEQSFKVGRYTVARKYFDLLVSSPYWARFTIPRILHLFFLRLTPLDMDMDARLEFLLDLLDHPFMVSLDSKVLTIVTVGCSLHKRLLNKLETQRSVLDKVLCSASDVTDLIKNPVCYNDKDSALIYKDVVTTIYDRLTTHTSRWYPKPTMYLDAAVWHTTS